jgi:hypothetical protein
VGRAFTESHEGANHEGEFFKVLGLVGLLAEELSVAAVDGKITVKEALRIVERICDSLRIEFVAELDE